MIQSTLVKMAKLGARQFAVISNMLLHQFDSIFCQELLPFDFYMYLICTCNTQVLYEHASLSLVLSNGEYKCEIKIKTIRPIQVYLFLISREMTGNNIPSWFWVLIFCKKLCTFPPGRLFRNVEKIYFLSVF